MAANFVYLFQNLDYSLFKFMHAFFFPFEGEKQLHIAYISLTKVIHYGTYTSVKSKKTLIAVSVLMLT